MTPFLLLLSGIGQPRTTVRADDGYIASRVAPADLVRKADAAVASLKNCQGRTTVLFEAPAGKGQSLGIIRVRDRQHVSSEFAISPNLSLLESCTVVRNGSVVSVMGRLEKGKFRVPAVKGFAVNSGTPLIEWLRNSGRFMMSGLIADSPAFKSFLESAMRDRSFKISVTERAITVDKRKYASVRITAQRVSSPKLKIAITFERASSLPITMIAEGDVKGGKARVIWNVGWQGPVKFPNTDFRVP